MLKDNKMKKLKEYLTDRYGYNEDDFNLVIEDMRNTKKNPFKIAKQLEVPTHLIFDVLGEL